MLVVRRGLCCTRSGSSTSNDVGIDDIAIYPERGVIVVDARYEARFPLFWVLDGVMKFDDLVIETTPVGRS